MLLSECLKFSHCINGMGWNRNRVKRVQTKSIFEPLPNGEEEKEEPARKRASRQSKQLNCIRDDLTRSSVQTFYDVI